MACTLSVMAQTRAVSGQVVNISDGEPIIGATVMPIGGGQGVATDVDGKFNLNVPANVKELQVSYIGMKTVKVRITNSPMRIELSSDAMQERSRR